MPIPSLDVRLRMLAAVDVAPGASIRARIKHASQQSYVCPKTEHEYRFTWRTISTWLYRYKKDGITTMEKKTRCDKATQRKVQVSELAEAISEVLPSLSVNKVGKLPKSVLYQVLLERNYFTRAQLAPTTFYRFIREHELLQPEATEKLRMAFAMLHANELWQGDTMYGPAIKQNDGSWKKTYLIAFIDDASRLITHGEFFYADDTVNMINAFRSALYKRGKPERLYFDNGSNYTAKEIHQACLRLNIRLTHAPVRDGAAKGKIERFFRGFRDRFLVRHTEFETLQQLNQFAQAWIEDDYNNQPHSSLGMTPLARFNLDYRRIAYLPNDEVTDEVFYVEETRKVSKVNIFSINNQKFECPVDLRNKSVQIRYDRRSRQTFIVYFNSVRMGEALPLNLYHNAQLSRDSQSANT